MNLASLVYGHVCSPSARSRASIERPRPDSEFTSKWTSYFWTRPKKRLDEAEADFNAALSIAQDCQYMLWALDARNLLVQVMLEKSEAKDRYTDLKNELMKVNFAANRAGYKWAASDSLFLLGDLEKIGRNSALQKENYRQCLAIRQDSSDPRSNIVLERLAEIV
jgi:hypothetical protein